jgi:eukaryotic-like serine/threonine-protein kinase
LALMRSSPLGAGGMGEVYRARDTRLGRSVAIKVLPTSFSDNAERFQRFSLEARAAASLNHPNILAVFDVGDGQSPYVVSELLEGETLRERLKNGPVSSRKAIDYSVQIARGLAAAHEKGIVHRDLKPENLFITQDGRVKILDFGLAKLTRPESAVDDPNSPTLQEVTEPGLVMGTAVYMAPEQVRGKTADARSDIFSFGAILYEMVCGKRAFLGETAADTLTAILKEDVPELSESARNIPPALDRIVRHCLEKSPTQRFQSAGDLAFGLETLTDGSPTVKTGAQPITHETRFSAHKIAIVVGVLALLLAAIALGWWIGRGTGVVPTPEYKQITFNKGVYGQRALHSRWQRHL